MLPAVCPFISIWSGKHANMINCATVEKHSSDNALALSLYHYIYIYSICVYAGYPMNAATNVFMIKNINGS